MRSRPPPSPRRRLPSSTMGDHLAAAFVGAIIGALVGVAVAWLLGFHSSRLGPSFMEIDVLRWVIGFATAFGVIGLVLGPVVGTLLGHVIQGLFAFERVDDRPRGGFSLLIALVALLVWWLFTRST